MLTIPKTQPKAPKIERISTQKWMKGVVTTLDDGRMPVDGLVQGDNMVLTEDGTIRPRPSLQKYGPQPVGTVLGELAQFRVVDGLDTTNWMVTMQAVARSEVQTLSITGTPTGGTFTLTYSGQTTSAIAYNASAATIQTALLALSNLDTGDVVCTGGALPGAAVTITFGGTLKNTDISAITTTDSLTGGTTPKSAITETTKGGTFGHIYIAKPEDTAWTKVDHDFDGTAKAHFRQLDDKVLITNGVDTFSYLSIPDSTVTVFDALDNPDAPTSATVSTDLQGTAYTIYYAVTANSKVGETTGTAKTCTVKYTRDQWGTDGTKSVEIAWDTVTGVQFWNVYCATTADGDDNPVWGLLASGISADTLTFTDYGVTSTGIPNTQTPLPLANATAGPKASRCEVINGRIWLTGDDNNPYYVWYGGDYGYEFDFTWANGGGFIPIGHGSIEIPIKVWNFRSGQGDPQIKCLTRGLNGGGKRYTIAPTTISLGSTSITVWGATEDYGASGTDSPDGLVSYNNSTYYPSRDGFKDLGTKPQLQNLLSNDDVSQTIQPDLSTISNEYMDGCVVMAFEGKIYWALPIGATTNNQIWVLDLDRQGAWMKPWSVKADWLTLIADNSGVTHKVVVQGSTIYELSYNTLTTDDGEAFITAGATGQIRTSDDGQDWMRLIKVVITVLRPQGLINFIVNGFTSNNKLVTVGTGSLDATANSPTLGWGEAGWSAFGWSNFDTVPKITANASQDVSIKVNKDVQYFTVNWSSTQAGSDYALSNMVGIYVDAGIKNLSK